MLKQFYDKLQLLWAEKISFKWTNSICVTHGTIQTGSKNFSCKLWQLTTSRFISEIRSCGSGIGLRKGGDFTSLSLTAKRKLIYSTFYKSNTVWGDLSIMLVHHFPFGPWEVICRKSQSSCTRLNSLLELDPDHTRHIKIKLQHLFQSN